MNIIGPLYGFIWRSLQANNCNSYLIRGSKNILIDPGHRHLFEHVRRGLADLGLTPQQIDLVLITHGHPDHLEAAALFKKPALIALGRREFDFVQSWSGATPWTPDFFLDEGKLRVGDQTFEVLTTPGHSPGSLCLYWPAYKALFTGDLIFNQGVGRVDLPGGAGTLLKESIRRMAELDVEYLLSGHGEVVQGKKAVEANFRMIESYWFNYL